MPLRTLSPSCGSRPSDITHRGLRTVASVIVVLRREGVTVWLSLAWKEATARLLRRGSPGLAGQSYRDFIGTMHLPGQLAAVDPIVASFCGGAVGVLSTLMVVEANNASQQAKRRCFYCQVRRIGYGAPVADAAAGCQLEGRQATCCSLYRQPDAVAGVPSDCFCHADGG
jgi:hypothetical protein